MLYAFWSKDQRQFMTGKIETILSNCLIRVQVLNHSNVEQPIPIKDLGSIRDHRKYPFWKPQSSTSLTGNRCMMIVGHTFMWHTPMRETSFTFYEDTSLHSISISNSGYHVWKQLTITYLQCLVVNQQFESYYKGYVYNTSFYKG